MPSVIGERVFVSDGIDKYITLPNAEYVRPLSIGSNWNRLRIGVLMAMTPNATSNILSCNFVMGVCSGATNPYGASSTTYFIGSGMTGSATMTYNAGTAGASYYTGSTTSWVSRIGTTLTTGGALTFLAVTTSGVYTQRRCAQYVDITKYSPSAANIAVTQWTETGAGTAHTQYDVTYPAFLYALEQAGTPVINGTNMNSNGTNGPFVEASGPLDTVDVYWNKDAFPWEVYGIAVYRFN